MVGEVDREWGMAGVQGGVEVGWKFWVRGLKGVGGIG